MLCLSLTDQITSKLAKLKSRLFNTITRAFFKLLYLKFYTYALPLKPQIAHDIKNFNFKQHVLVQGDDGICPDMQLLKPMASKNISFVKL